MKLETFKQADILIEEKELLEGILHAKGFIPHKVYLYGGENNSWLLEGDNTNPVVRVLIEDLYDTIISETEKELENIIKEIEAL